MALVLESIKDRVPPNFKINLLMTDDDKVSGNVMARVFGDMLHKHALCKWHVHQTWQRKLRAVIHDTSLRNTVYNILMI